MSGVGLDREWLGLLINYWLINHAELIHLTIVEGGSKASEHFKMRSMCVRYLLFTICCLDKALGLDGNHFISIQAPNRPILMWVAEMKGPLASYIRPLICRQRTIIH